MRLIDADELREKCDAPYWCVWLSDIDNAPTIEPPTKCIAQICIDTDEVVERIKEEYDIVGNTDAVGEWIPCSERLPKHTSHCLITNGDMTWVALWADGVWTSVGLSSIRLHNVIAWMPLPEPYKKEVEVE